MIKLKLDYFEDLTNLNELIGNTLSLIYTYYKENIWLNLAMGYFIYAKTIDSLKFNKEFRFYSTLITSSAYDITFFFAL